MTTHRGSTPLTTEQLTGNVFAFVQEGGAWGYANAGLVVDGGHALLVDTFYTLELTRRLRAALAQAAPGARVETLVNTHLNGDHCFGNQLFPGAEVITSAANQAGAEHELGPEFYQVLQRQPPPGAAGRYFHQYFGGFDFSGIHLTPATTTFSQRMELRVGSVPVELLEVGPAHTDGDVVVRVPEAGVVFCGDIFFHHGHPVVWSGPLTGWVAACDRLLDTGAHTFVPGHGPVADRDDFRRFRDYLRYVGDRAAQLAGAGVPVADAARQIPLDAYAGWSSPERVLTAVAAVYRERGAPTPQNPLDLLGPMAQLAEDLAAERL